MVINKLKSWWRSYASRKRFCTNERTPFYEIGRKYLPAGNESIILDIGPGLEEFPLFLSNRKESRNLLLLEGNPETARNLKERFNNVVMYKAPGPLPLDKNSADFIHCSHLIEHLYYNELYDFLKEIDKVLKQNGVLVISAPVLWERFYDDLSHVKPYNPETLTSYLCGGRKNRSAKPISEGHTVLELVYRYQTKTVNEGWGSELAVFDLLIQCIKKLLNKIGIREYIKNGYTLVLKKPAR